MSGTPRGRARLPVPDPLPQGLTQRCPPCTPPPALAPRRVDSACTRIPALWAPRGEATPEKGWVPTAEGACQPLPLRLVREKKTA